MVLPRIFKTGVLIVFLMVPVVVFGNVRPNPEASYPIEELPFCKSFLQKRVRDLLRQKQPSEAVRILFSADFSTAKASDIQYARMLLRRAYRKFFLNKAPSFASPSRALVDTNVMSLSDDGKYLFTVSKEGVYQVWNTHTFFPIGFPVKTKRKNPMAIGVLPDKNKVFIIFKEQCAEVRELRTGQLLYEQIGTKSILKNQTGVGSYTIYTSKEGRFYFLHSNLTELKTYEVRSSEYTDPVDQRWVTGPLEYLSVIKTDHLLFAGFNPNYHKILVYVLIKGKIQGQERFMKAESIQVEEPVSALAWNRPGPGLRSADASLIYGTLSGKIKSISLSKPRVESEISVGSPVQAIVSTPNPDEIIIATKNNKLSRWNLKTAQKVAESGFKIRDILNAFGISKNDFLTMIKGVDLNKPNWFYLHAQDQKGVVALTPQGDVIAWELVGFSEIERSDVR